MQALILELEQAQRVATARNYRAVLRSVARATADIPLAALDTEWVARYEAWLLASGVCRNTSSMYLRCLRAVYHRAMGSTLPFRHAYTGVARTAKRALPLNVIRKIKALPLPVGSTLTLSRDLFLFSLYTRGMSFIDMAYLRGTDLRDGTLTYRRRKTRQLLRIRWEPCMQSILDRHPSTTSFLLPIIRREDGTERRQYETALHLVNHHLKHLAALVPCTPFSLYAARHSWATLAQARHVPLSVISQALGHDSERTTQIYLDALAPDIIDEANRLILVDL